MNITRNNYEEYFLLYADKELSAEEKLAAIQNIFPNHLQNLKNNFSVYQNGKLRIK